MPVKIIYGAIVLLIIGAFPMPYGYYTLLRIVITAVCIWASIVAFDRDLDSVKWFFVGIAILFNPIIPIYLTKEVWVVIDTIVALFLFIAKGKFKIKPDT